MDVYYLAIAYLTTLRNWTSDPAFVVGRFLYFYRLVGVVAFELTHARALLLVFPNTFEYFFIAYEAIRSRWSTLRLVLTGWITVAAAIWVVVKLPQEYWIHIAQLDVTDLLAEHAWAPPLLVGILLVLAGVLWFVVRPRTPEADHRLRLAADPLPVTIDEGHEVAAWVAGNGRVWSRPTFEKLVLVTLLCVVFAQTLPGVRATDLELAIGTGLLVVANAALSLAAARRSVSVNSLAIAFGARMLVNMGLVVAASIVLGTGSLNEGATVFFLFLLSLLTTMHDRWLPVREYRLSVATEAGG